MVAQGTHAAVLAVFGRTGDQRVIDWMYGGKKAVCVRCDSEQELFELVRRADAAGLITELVRDAGLTEFAGVPTLTCAAIGPGLVDEIDAITGNLKLL